MHAFVQATLVPQDSTDGATRSVRAPHVGSHRHPRVDDLQKRPPRAATPPLRNQPAGGVHRVAIAGKLPKTFAR
eukprot:scaffold326562_cov62-Tisochrysis_lutea.AAC.2